MGISGLLKYTSNDLARGGTQIKVIDWPPWIENIGQTELKITFLLSVPFKNPIGLLKSKYCVFDKILASL